MVIESKLLNDEKYKWLFIVILLFIFYATEGYSKYLELTIGQNSAVPRFIKLIAIGFFLGFIAIQKKYNQLLQITAIIGIFSIGQFSLNSENSFNQDIIVVFGRYLYPIILFYFISNLKLNSQSRNKLFIAFEWLMVINSSLILLGFLFDIPLFKTYEGRRFGYNGLFLTSATSSYVYLLTLFYFFLKIKQTKSFKSFSFLFILFSCLFIGTKTIFVFIYILSLFFILNFLKKRTQLILIVITSSIIICFAYYVFFLSDSILNELRVQKGMFSTIMSFRDKLLIRDTLPYVKENWDVLNYIFGGIDDIKVRSEMGFIDVFFFFGLIGGLYYLKVYFKSFITFKIDKNLAVFLIILFVLVFLAGNFFFYATIPIYLAVFRERIKGYMNAKTENII